MRLDPVTNNASEVIIMQMNCHLKGEIEEFQEEDHEECYREDINEDLLLPMLTDQDERQALQMLLIFSSPNITAHINSWISAKHKYNNTQYNKFWYGEFLDITIT